ncbi:Large ribosomal subunit protein uL22m [Exophiala dermatitidis]
MPSSTPTTARERIAAAQRRAQQKLEEQRKEQERSLVHGGLSSSSAFAAELQKSPEDEDQPESFAQRNPTHMAQVLNPNPSARARWQRRMVIRHIRHGGRLNKEMKIARTERNHLLRSHFFKTSMKKLAPLARQIAGKSIDEAILQMRFSKKKVAQEVRQHLIQARNEAIVMKGMGLKPDSTQQDAAAGEDPSETRPLPHQTPLKTYKKGHAPHETDIYVAEAWTNRGPYGAELESRARGRTNVLHPPYTGISVLLKEEKTRMRQAAEKEAKSLRKRMGKNMWVHLPDRKITTQRQHLLW